jgi:hypothetical protein
MGGTCLRGGTDSEGRLREVCEAHKPQPHEHLTPCIVRDGRLQQFATYILYLLWSAVTHKRLL